METLSKTQVMKDLKQKSIVVSREFEAPLPTVWRAYTDSAILDQWWGPAPWRAETKTMDFSVGGYWLYAMVGPANEKHWARMDYTAIDHLKSFSMKDGFCDENGVLNTAFPVSTGKNIFTETDNGTFVEFKMIYPTEQDLKTIIDMGFEQGITICIEQLVALLKQNKV